MSGADVLQRWAPLAIPSAIEAPPEVTGDLLGGVIGDMAAAVSDATQTPPSMATMVALGALSACAQGRLRVRLSALWSEMVVLWIVPLSDSGSRKSAVLSPFMHPILHFEKMQHDRWRSEVARNASIRRGAKARIEALEKEIARAKTADDREAARRLLQQEIELMPDEVYVPRIQVQDVTTERRQQILAENRGAIAMLSDEPGPFMNWAGLYSANRPNFEVDLKAYDGSPLVVDRQARRVYIERPAQTVVLMCQPGVWEEVGANKRFRHQGLLARPWYVFPRSNIGERDTRRASTIDADLQARFERFMLDVLETFCEPASARDLSLSNEARRAFDDIAANNEAELGVSGDLAGLRDWGSKLPGRVARTATLIEVARSGPRAEAVSFESMMAAAVMSHRLTAHAKSAFGIVGVDPAQADARALLEWVRARGELLFSSAQAQKALEHRFRKVDQLRAAAAVLTSWGVLSVPQQQKNERARASTIWMVNPAALEPAP